MSQGGYTRTYVSINTTEVDFGPRILFVKVPIRTLGLDLSVIFVGVTLEKIFDQIQGRQIGSSAGVVGIHLDSKIPN